MTELMEAFLVQIHHWLEQKVRGHLCFQMSPHPLVAKLFGDRSGDALEGRTMPNIRWSSRAAAPDSQTARPFARGSFGALDRRGSNEHIGVAVVHLRHPFSDGCFINYRGNTPESVDWPPHGAHARHSRRLVPSASCSGFDHARSGSHGCPAQSVASPSAIPGDCGYFQHDWHSRNLCDRASQVCGLTTRSRGDARNARALNASVSPRTHTHMLKFLGITFLVLVACAALFLVWAFQQDNSARRYVASAVPAVFKEWDAEALRQRSSEELINDAQFRAGVPQMFAILGNALGRLKTTEEPEGSAGYGWGDASPAQGTYGDYFIRAEFERGAAELHLIVVRERGGWRIRAFNVNSPVLARPSDDRRAANKSMQPTCETHAADGCR